MKEVLAVIQMNKMECTKDALALIGFPSFTAYKAYGRGKQRGLSVAYPSEFKEEEIKEKKNEIPAQADDFRSGGR